MKNRRRNGAKLWKNEENKNNNRLNFRRMEVRGMGLGSHWFESSTSHYTLEVSELR